MSERAYALPVPPFEAPVNDWDTTGLGQAIDNESHAELQETSNRVSSVRYLVIKRLLDVVGASLALIACLPIAVVIAVGIRLTSEGPVFYREKRVGRHGQLFTLLKFRSMHTHDYLERKFGMNFTPEQLATLRTHGKSKGDPRIFALGRLLRAFSLDELPQFINVVRGDMSLVGPRPVVRGERDQFGSYGGSFYDLALPGISGLWQVSGRSDLSFEQRVSLDIQYAREWSLLLDLSILMRTLPTVLAKRGAY